MEIDEDKWPMIIGVTGHVEKEYVLKAIESGMKKVNKKPLKLYDFANLLIELNYIEKLPVHIEKE